MRRASRTARRASIEVRKGHMRMNAEPIGIALLAAALLGCGGSLNKGPDGSTSGACSTLGACECIAANDRCSARTEACWCPSECNPNIACVCGGGRFLACEEKAAAGTCGAELARVQTMCAGMAFAGQIDALCTADPNCIQGCLAQLTTAASCAQIDCSFCLACDCAPPMTPSPFRNCVSQCALLDNQPR